MSIAFSAMLVSLVYGTIFCGFGIIWKNGVVLCLIFAAWELGMAFVSIFTGGDSSIRYFSVIGWGLTIVDAGTLIFWPDNFFLIEQGLWGGGHQFDEPDFFTGEVAYVDLPGAQALAGFSGDPGLGISAWASMLTASLVLTFQGAIAWYIGQTIFKGKEVD